MSADEFKNLEDFYDSLTDTVEIPHQSIVNPNLFFVRVKNETINYQLVELEAKIKDFCLDKSVRFDPAVGEVSFKFFPFTSSYNLFSIRFASTMNTLFVCEFTLMSRRSTMIK